MNMKMSIGAWRRTATRLVLAGAVAVGLSTTMKPQEARANHNWVGPAIAGFIVGAAVAHSAQRHRHYKKRYAYGHPKRRHGHVQYGYAPTYYYPAPVVVPMFGIGIYPGW